MPKRTEEDIERVPYNLVVLAFNPKERMFAIRLPGDREIISLSDTTRRAEIKLTDMEQQALKGWWVSKEKLERYKVYLKRELKLPLYREKYLDVFFNRLKDLRPEVLKRRLIMLWFSNDEHYQTLKEMYLRLMPRGPYGPPWVVEEDVFGVIERLRACRCQLANVWLSFEYF